VLLLGSGERPWQRAAVVLAVEFDLDGERVQ